MESDVLTTVGKLYSLQLGDTQQVVNDLGCCWHCIPWCVYIAVKGSQVGICQHLHCNPALQTVFTYAGWLLCSIALSPCAQPTRLGHWLSKYHSLHCLSTGPVAVHRHLSDTVMTYRDGKCPLT